MATFTTEQINAMIAESEKSFTATWAGGEMSVRRNVDFKTMMEIINTTVEACFNELGAYMPEVRYPVMWSCIVEKYTDVELPEDIEAKVNLLIYTDLHRAIIECVDIDQICSIEDAIEKRIANLIDAGNNVLLNGVMNTYASLAAIHSEMENALKKIGGVDASILFGATNADKKEVGA